MSDEFDSAMRRAFQEMIGRAEAEAFGLNVANSNAVPEKALDVRKTLSDMAQILRSFRRTQITFVVDRAHQGPPIKHETPNDGERIELSWLDANRVHGVWPLKLHRVLDEDAAEFVPVSAGQFAPAVLEQPPYTVPPEESLEDWLKG